jgi:transcriptional regulator with XRE-family HTH domain
VVAQQFAQPDAHPLRGFAPVTSSVRGLTGFGMNWSDRLRQAMTEAGFTQERLARTIGSQQSRIGHYCHGRREPDFATLCKIVSTLGITTDWLLFGDPGSKPSASSRIAALHASLSPSARTELEAVAHVFEVAYGRAVPPNNSIQRTPTRSAGRRR